MDALPGDAEGITRLVMSRASELEQFDQLFRCDAFACGCAVLGDGLDGVLQRLLGCGEPQARFAEHIVFDSANRCAARALDFDELVSVLVREPQVR